MDERNDNRVRVRTMVRRVLLFTVLVFIIMAAILIVGSLAGGVYWIGAVALCVLLYVVLAARAAFFRQRLAQWRARNRQGD
jgi:lipopolysaccharide export LptBFGC system permease protein LptF